MQSGMEKLTLSECLPVSKDSKWRPYLDILLLVLYWNFNGNVVLTSAYFTWLVYGFSHAGKCIPSVKATAVISEDGI